MLGKSTHLQVIPQKRTPKTQQIAITDMREKPVIFFNVLHGRQH